MEPLPEVSGFCSTFPGDDPSEYYIGKHELAGLVEGNGGLDLAEDPTASHGPDLTMIVDILERLESRVATLEHLRRRDRSIISHLRSRIGLQKWSHLLQNHQGPKRYRAFSTRDHNRPV